MPSSYRVTASRRAWSGRASWSSPPTGPCSSPSVAPTARGIADLDGDGVADEDVVGSGYGDAHSLAFAADGTMYVAGPAPSLLSSSGRTSASAPDGRSSICRAGGVHTTRTVARAARRPAPRERRLDVQRLPGDGSTAGRHPHRRRRTVRTRESSMPRSAERGRASPSTRRNCLGDRQSAATCSATTCHRRRSTASKTGRTPVASLPRGHDRRPRVRRRAGSDHGPRGLRRRGDAGGDVPGPYGAARHRLLGRPRLHRFPRFLEPLDEGRLRGRACALVRRWAIRRAGTFLTGFPTMPAATPADGPPASSSAATVRSTSPTTRPADLSGHTVALTLEAHQAPA